MRVLSYIAVILLAAQSLHPGRAAAEAEQPPILPPGQVRAMVTAGPIVIDREWTWGLDLSLGAGITERMELALPLALGLLLVGDEQGSGIVLGVGIVDIWVTEKRGVLLSPTVVIAGQARISAEASLRGTLDLTGAEDWSFVGDHPTWLRGAVALVIDMGPWLTVAGGLSHQRLLTGEGAPPGTRRTGWVGDARFSVGAVRAEAFRELPTLAIHIVDWLDLIGLVRLDIDTDRESTDLRLLVGTQLRI